MKQVMSGLLVVWLSGFAFLFCCHAPRTAAQNGEFCPLAKAGRHCAKSKTDDAPNFSKPQNQTLDCCGFISTFFDKVRKIEKTEFAVEFGGIVKFGLPQIFAVQKDVETTENYRSLIFSRQKIFIENRAFLI